MLKDEVNIQVLSDRYLIPFFKPCFRVKEIQSCEKSICFCGEQALFDWPIVLQYDVKAKYRFISRKFSVFSPDLSLNQPKPTCVCIRSTETIQFFLSLFVCCFCFVRAFSIQRHAKIANLSKDEINANVTP